jgi:hypothetical protein
VPFGQAFWINTPDWNQRLEQVVDVSGWSEKTIPDLKYCLEKRGSVPTQDGPRFITAF